MAFMSSINSLWAGGWKRLFNFEAMRYSRNEIGSSCGALIEREKCRAGVRSARASVAMGLVLAGARRGSAALVSGEAVVTFAAGLARCRTTALRKLCERLLVRCAGNSAYGQPGLLQRRRPSPAEPSVTNTLVLDVCEGISLTT